MSNLGKPGCPECRIRPGGKVRVNDFGECVRCGELCAAPVVLVPVHPQPLRDDRAPQRPWRPSEAA